jgi:hypothetical protein
MHLLFINLLLYISDSIIDSMVRRSAIYPPSNITTPRKQQTKVGLQKDTESATHGRMNYKDTEPYMSAFL